MSLREIIVLDLYDKNKTHHYEAKSVVPIEPNSIDIKNYVLEVLYILQKGYLSKDKESNQKKLFNLLKEASIFDNGFVVENYKAIFCPSFLEKNPSFLE